MRDRTVFALDCRNSPDCGQAGLPAEGSLMRRPLFMACLCLVIVLAIGRILTGADTGDAGVLPPDGSPVRITGRIDTRTSETIILKSISIIQNDLKYSYSGKLQCELTNTQEVQSLRLGQHIVLEGVFSHFDAATNHGEFDVRAYSAGKGIGGRVRKAQILAAEEDYNFLREKLFAFRRRLHDRLAKVFPEKEASVMQCRGKLQSVQPVRIDGQGQVIHPGISEALIMLGFDTVEQENAIRIVGEALFQFFFQRTVIAPCQIGNLMRMAQRCDQREEVNAHDGIVGIGL